MVSNKLVWPGLCIVALGWIVLLFGESLKQIGEDALGRPLSIGGDAHLAGIAESMIFSGFGLAILGALQAGRATLTLFFEAVLRRAAAARAQPSPVMATANYVDPDEVVERGRIGNRPYALYADGSVEVETLLGLRRFSSFVEAEEFIGS